VVNQVWCQQDSLHVDQLCNLRDNHLQNQVHNQLGNPQCNPLVSPLGSLVDSQRDSHLDGLLGSLQDSHLDSPPLDHRCHFKYDCASLLQLICISCPRIYRTTR
jgi:hypothetical protein